MVIFCSYGQTPLHTSFASSTICSGADIQVKYISVNKPSRNTFTYPSLTLPLHTSSGLLWAQKKQRDHSAKIRLPIHQFRIAISLSVTLGNFNYHYISLNSIQNRKVSKSEKYEHACLSDITDIITKYIQ